MRLSRPPEAIANDKGMNVRAMIKQVVLLFLMALVTAPMATRADMPQPVIRYYALSKAEWKRGMERLQNGDSVEDKSLSRDDLNNMEMPQNGDEQRDYWFHAISPAIIVLLIVIVDLVLRKFYYKPIPCKKPKWWEYGVILILLVPYIVVMYVVFPQTTKMSEVYDFGWDNNGRWHGHIAIAPRMGESYEE